MYITILSGRGYSKKTGRILIIISMYSVINIFTVEQSCQIVKQPFNTEAITCDSQAVLYDGQAVIYDGQAVLYDGQAVIYDGQVVLYDGQAILYDGLAAMYDGQ